MSAVMQTRPGPALGASAPVTAAGPVTTQARVVRAEWTKLRALRSTWWCALTAVVLIVGLGAAIAGSGTAYHVSATNSAAKGISAALLGLLFAQLVVGVVGSRETSTGSSGRHDENMALQLAQEEPEAGPWRVELLSTVVNAVTRRRPDQGSSGRPAVLAIDGRSNNGKTTLAARISELVPGSVVIHTDDIAWAHSRFGWADLLIDGILVPVHHGQAVSYRPPRWDEHGREGSIEIPAGCPLLIIEGDGAGRREVAHLIDTLIWVQADEREAGRRTAARAANRPAADLANRPADGAPFDDDGWMAEEIPFNTAQRTWERADIIVCGTPEIPYDPSTELVIAPPPVA